MSLLAIRALSAHLVALFCVLLAITAVPASKASDDLNLNVQLIWGTDESKPNDPELKDVDAKLKEKLCRVFKWKNYFQVAEKKAEVAKSGSKRFRLSPKCEVEITHVDDNNLEIKLFGEGRPAGTLRKSIKSLTSGELGVLSGDDKQKYGDAWFVVVSSAK